MSGWGSDSSTHYDYFCEKTPLWVFDRVLITSLNVRSWGAHIFKCDNISQIQLILIKYNKVGLVNLHILHHSEI